MQNKLYDANLVAHTFKILLVNKFKLEFRKWFKNGSSIIYHFNLISVIPKLCIKVCVW